MNEEQPYTNHRNGVSNPKYPIPGHMIIAVEHPFKIRDPIRAIESLGGERKITKLVAARESHTHEAQLLLHPGRHQLNSVISSNVSAKSLVCQVTVPKLIGKRTRGSDETVQPHGLSEKQRILRGLREQAERCEFRVIGRCPRVHKFRTMPDFAYSQERNGFMRSFSDTFGTLKYHNVKKFELRDNEDFKPDTDLIPPPVFSPHTIPFNYAYQQNASVKVMVGVDGEVTALNESTAQKSILPRVAIDVDRIPTAPPAGVIPLSAQPEASKNLVKKLEALFEERPIWSRRAVLYQLQDQEALGALKWLFQYVGYEFASGPWAMTIIRYGVDPRTTPDCRFYQSITLHFEPPAKYASNPRGGARTTAKIVTRVDQNGVPGYIFTGQTLVLDGKTWQVCDFQDPLISAIFSTDNLRTECDMDSDGWFKNGTWAKAKVIFRYKARAILKEDSSWLEEDFVQAAEMPDEFNPSLKDLPIDTTGWTRRATLIAFNIKHGSLTFGKNRSQWASHGVSDAVMQALRKHETGSMGQQDTRETLEELLGEEQEALRDASGSEIMDGSEDEVAAKGDY